MELTKEQMKIVGNMEVPEMMELVKSIIFNTDVKSDRDGLMFLKGVTAMYDFVQMRTANHWHGNPATDKICQIENDFATEMFEDAFMSLHPDGMYKWKEIGKLQNEINALKGKK